MEEGANSWIRRTKFSQTVHHRWDALRLSPIPLAALADDDLGSKLKTRTFASDQKSTLSYSQVMSSSNLKTRTLDSNEKSSLSYSQILSYQARTNQRSRSPLPQTVLPEEFKEARADRKRFSTPVPRRRNAVEDIRPKENKAANSRTSFNVSPIRQLSSIKFSDRSKTRKESSWTRYFDHGGGRVTSVEEAEDLDVDLSKLFLGHRFAHGAHSRLYHGVYNDKPVAVKIITVPDDDEKGDMAARLEKLFNREVTLLFRLHHANVIKLIAAFRKPSVYCVVMEYLSEGCLRAYLRRLEQNSLDVQKLISFALDIARGMEYIHSQGVIHRDLKPENILIDKNCHLKVADFGIACEEAHCDPLTDDPGTYRWMAPEMIKHKLYGQKVDVYSFGLILWEMVAGRIPYEEMTPIQAAFAVVNKNLRPVIPLECPPAMGALIEQCWSLQPEKRPEFWQIVMVLERFESSLARDGTLNLVQNLACKDHKNGLLRWIQKLRPSKPKFT